MTIKEINKNFSGRLIGKPLMKTLVCEAVSILPEDLQEFVTKNIWFLSSHEDAWAFTFRGSDIKDQHLIVLSDELLSENKSQIIYTILHEIGHVVLKHKNSMGRMQTQSEIDKQEFEADRFTKKYLLGSKTLNPYG